MSLIPNHDEFFAVKNNWASLKFSLDVKEIVNCLVIHIINRIRGFDHGCDGNWNLIYNSVPDLC